MPKVSTFSSPPNPYRAPDTLMADSWLTHPTTCKITVARLSEHTNGHARIRNRAHNTRHPQHAANAPKMSTCGQKTSICGPKSDLRQAQKRPPHEPPSGAAVRRWCGDGGSGSGGLDGGGGPLAREDDPPPLGLTPDPLGVPLERCSGRWVHAITRARTDMRARDCTRATVQARTSKSAKS